MEALLISAGLVALAEVGDKTQILAIVLAARFGKPWPIVWGILVATLANHGLASAVGAYAGGLLEGPWLKWVLGGAFLVFAVWTLIPDKFDRAPGKHASQRSVFLTTLFAFFLVEMGDKTQVATIALAARFQQVLLVTAGTTLGMMLANVPAVLIGEAASERLPIRWIRIGAAASFAALGIWVLMSA